MSSRRLCSFVFATLAGMPLAAKAYPAVGDKVTWSGQLQRVDGSAYSIQITKEVVAYDSVDKIWKVKVDALLGDQKTTDIFETKDLYSPRQFQEMITHCTAQGGQLEDLKLPLGTYKTCKLSTTTEDGTLVEKWWGDMPFGVISKTTRDKGKAAEQAPDIKALLVGL